jgi:hypothetical protein
MIFQQKMKYLCHAWKLHLLPFFKVFLYFQLLSKSMLNNPFHQQTRPTLLWLKQSFEANNLRGSSAYYSRLRYPLRGWSAPYPETTGYIIETLLAYHQLTTEQWMLDYAIQGADWIISLQKEDGSLPGGIGEHGKPSVFNTGMMLFGLIAIYEKTNDIKYLASAKKAVQWLLSILEKDGSWQQGAYTEGFTPSYYTRVIWAILKANQHLQSTDIEHDMRRALQFYKNRLTSKNSISDWAFAKNEPAFTHTIAYTMRGFLESSQLLNDVESLTIAQNIAFRLIEDFNKKGKLAGTYDENWKGDYRFVCLTGNAQLSINLFRLYQITDNPIFNTYANLFFETIKDAPSKIPIKGYQGGIAGSNPLWGKYQKFQYINWAAKFWLDAAYFIKTKQR